MRRASPIDTTSFRFRFPLTYTNRTSITVNGGWQRIVEDLFAGLETLAFAQQDCGEIPLFVQEVFQKYGTLRVAMSRVTAASERLVDHAELQSTRICEFCSSPALAREIDEWTVTLCERCHAGSGHEQDDNTSRGP